MNGAMSSLLTARLPLEPVETKPISELARTERTQCEHAQPAPGPDATTWSQRLQPRSRRWERHHSGLSLITD
jgi:hypothetical protein